VVIIGDMNLTRIIGAFILINLAMPKLEAQIHRTHQYDFLNWYISNNHTYALSDSLIEIPNLDLKAIQSLKLPDAKLSVTDRISMHRQALKNKKLKALDTTLLKAIDWKFKRNLKNITVLSLPIFSVKNTVAIIYRKHYCGPLCGQECLEIYVKKRGKWQHSKYDPPCVEY
jgi:hypothetical protein